MVSEKRIWQEQLGKALSDRVGEVGELMAQYGLTRVEVRIGNGSHLHIERQPVPAIVEREITVARDTERTMDRFRAAENGGDPAADPHTAAAPREDTIEQPIPGEIITSPLVGTVYLAADPGGPTFVQIGDQVTKGQTLMIVEAMKVMNKIEAPRSGTITEILVEDGQAAEFAQGLIRIA